MPAKDDVAGRFSRADAGFQFRADDADPFPKLRPVVFAVGVPGDLDGSAGEAVVSGDGVQERGFAGAVGAQDNPVLAWHHFPADVVENGRRFEDREAYELYDRGRVHLARRALIDSRQLFVS